MHDILKRLGIDQDPRVVVFGRRWRGVDPQPRREAIAGVLESTADYEALVQR